VAAIYDNLHGTSCQTAEKIACVAASRMQNLHALAAVSQQSRQYVFCNDAGRTNI